MRIFEQLDQKISEEEIEEMIILAINKKLLEKTAEIKSDVQEQKIDFNSMKFKLDFEQFKAVIKDN